MSTISKAFENWALFSVVLSLEESGVLAYLRAEKQTSIEDVATKLSLNELLLTRSLAFVSHAFPEIVTIRNGFIRAGRDLHMLRLINQTHFALAYKDEVHRLTALLKNEAVPIRSSSVRGDFLGRSSEIYSSKFYSHILEALQSRRNTTDTLIDLGCGAGALLTKIQQETNIPALFGVDRNPISCTEDTKDTPNNRSISYINADLYDVPAWASRIKETAQTWDPTRVVLTFVTVLHEFTKTEEYFSTFISQLKKDFRGATVLIAEQLFFPDEEIHLLPPDQQVPVDFYQLVHTATEQGEPKTHQQWRTFFKKEGLEIQSTALVDQVSSVYTVIL